MNKIENHLGDPMLLRFAAVVVFCLGISSFLANIETRNLDMFFLDWKQIIASPRAPRESELFKILDVTLLKANKGINGELLEAKKLFQLIQQVACRIQGRLF